MGVDLAVQTAIRARLIASPAVTDIVPAGHILDRNASPAPRPGIVLGETQLVDEGSSIARRLTRVFHTIHVWKTETSREGVKMISAAIRTALMAGRLDLGDGYHAADCRISQMRALSDPDGETSHGVVTVECLVEEVAS